MTVHLNQGLSMKTVLKEAQKELGHSSEWNQIWGAIK